MVERGVVFAIWWVIFAGFLGQYRPLGRTRKWLRDFPHKNYQIGLKNHEFVVICANHLGGFEYDLYRYRGTPSTMLAGLELPLTAHRTDFRDSCSDTLCPRPSILLIESCVGPFIPAQGSVCRHGTSSLLIEVFLAQPLAALFFACDLLPVIEPYHLTPALSRAVDRGPLEGLGMD